MTLYPRRKIVFPIEPTAKQISYAKSIALEFFKRRVTCKQPDLPSATDRLVQLIRQELQEHGTAMGYRTQRGFHHRVCSMYMECMCDRISQ